MATYADITADIIYLRDRETSVFAKLADGEVVALRLVSARAELAAHLSEALNFTLGTSEATEILDEVATEQNARIRHALGLLQLAIYFGSLPASEFNAQRAETYRKEYNQARRGFHALLRRKSGTARVRTYVRRF